MSSLDFSSWQGVVTTLIGLVVVTLIMVGIRLLVMQTVQQRRQRENRQINERLRLLIAAYKTLGGSFTGNLAVDPAHLRDLRSARASSDPSASIAEEAQADEDIARPDTFDRPRRIRDAVEAALSDVILLGTETQVALAAQAATDLAAGRPVHTDDLVVSLREFIREVLDLEPVPATLAIPKQGPARPGGGGASGRGKAGTTSGTRAGAGQDRSGGGTGGGGAAGGAAGGGMGAGVVGGLAHGALDGDR